MKEEQEDISKIGVLSILEKDEAMQQEEFHWSQELQEREKIEDSKRKDERKKKGEDKTQARKQQKPTLGEGPATHTRLQVKLNSKITTTKTTNKD